MQLKNKGTTLVIDLGATNLRFALASSNKITNLLRVSTPKAKNSQKFIEKLAKEIKKYINKNKVLEETPISMSVAGPVMDEGRKLVFLTEITGEFIPFIELERILGKEIFVINDAEAAVLAERKFGVGGNDLMYITISSGIGAGVIKNGKILADTETEVGHMEIKSEYTVQCSCDGTNHWEAFTSGKHLPSFFREWAKDQDIDFSEYNTVYKIMNLAREKDSIALEFLKEVYKINAVGVKMVDKKFNSKKIVLGGGLILNCADIILPGLKSQLSENIYRKISVTKLGDEISLIGASIHANSFK